jgi:hypothetical protein
VAFVYVWMTSAATSDTAAAKPAPFDS